MSVMATLYENLLDEHTREGLLWHSLPDQRVLCYACGHRCKISEGRRGVCKVRFNDGGVLKVPHGYVAALQCDPIEKKPFFHVSPGARALTFGMLGCDYHCSYCQNWNTSQALRDSEAQGAFSEVTPDRLLALAASAEASVIASSYNEPLITAEWSAAIFAKARERGLVTAFISNGNATAEVLDYLQPLLDCYKVDLKSMRDLNYRKLGGRLSVVLDTIRSLHERGIWVEIVTLVIPEFNDSQEELTEAAEFIASVSPDIPWHVTAFHPDYKMTDRDGTGADRLLRAVEIGKSAGLRFVYAGNLPGRVARYEDTQCPGCSATLVERTGYQIYRNLLEKDGKCPQCGYQVPGLWGVSGRFRGHNA